MKQVYESLKVIRETLGKNGIEITERQINLLEKFSELLLEQNQKVNLISRRDEENIWSHHILHCVSLLFHRKFPSSGRILDLGTGGGLPGIVYAILHPGIKFTLLDSTRKKIEAVQSIVSRLELHNVITVWGRAEEIAIDDKYAGKYNIVTARAVAGLDKLVKWTAPFLSPESSAAIQPSVLIPHRSLVAFKGGNIDDELVSLKSQKNINILDIELLDIKEDKKVVIISFI